MHRSSSAYAYRRFPGDSCLGLAVVVGADVDELCDCARIIGTRIHLNCESYDVFSREPLLGVCSAGGMREVGAGTACLAGTHRGEERGRCRRVTGSRKRVDADNVNTDTTVGQSAARPLSAHSPPSSTLRSPPLRSSTLPTEYQG